MSFRYLTLARPASTLVARAAALQPAVRPFSVSVMQQKTVTDSVKDAAKTVDRKAGDIAVSGIEAGETVVDKAKGAVGVGSTEELKGKAKGTYEEVKGQASGKTAEAKGQVKGAAEQVKGSAERV